MYKLYFLLAVLSFFLILNITASQDISPTYFKLINGDKKAVVEFLSRIKKLPEFTTEFIKYKDHVADLEKKLYEEDLKRKQVIKKFEQILEKSPKSRDALYSLYNLYKQGDPAKSEEYLKRAKEVDPEIN